MRGVRGGGPEAGAGGGVGVRRPDLLEQGLDAVDPVLVLVQHEGEFGLRLLGDGVDGAPTGQRGHGHLGHQRERLVALQGAGEQVGGFDEEGERAAAQPFQLGEAGALDGQRDPVGGELEPQGLLVGVAAGCLGGDAERSGEPALDLERDGDHRPHAGAGQQRYGAGDGGEVLVDGGHAGAAVAAGAGLDGDPGEALAGGGQAGGGAYLELGLVVGGEQQVGGVAVEHVAGALHGALEQAVEVVGGGGADEDLEGVGRLAAVGGAAVGAGRAAVRGLEDGPLLGAYQQAYGGGLAGGVADAQVRAVDGQHPAVGAAQAVGALPAGELEGVGEADAGAGGLRPGGEVGERLSDDVGGGVAEEVGRRRRSSG